jgi:hypothetical protein
MPRMRRLAAAIALVSSAQSVGAQTTLGELLKSGATPLSAEEFQQYLVGRIIVGPTATGGTMELLYASSGVVIGSGSVKRGVYTLAPVTGTWTINDKGKICTTMRIGGQWGAPANVGEVSLPPRCQWWFKSGGQYFLSDSDSDRRAKVLPRTVKP